jgi:hypothetical protein
MRTPFCLFLPLQGPHLYVDRFTRVRRRSRSSDEIALRVLHITVHHLTDLSDGVDDGRTSGVANELGERIGVASALGPRIAPVHCAAGSDGETNFGVTPLCRNEIGLFLVRIDGSRLSVLMAAVGGRSCHRPARLK